MERNQKRQSKADVRPDHEKVKLDRRYREIGISAVKAAIQPQQDESVRSDPNPIGVQRRGGGQRGRRAR